MKKVQNYFIFSIKYLAWAFGFCSNLQQIYSFVSLGQNMDASLEPDLRFVVGGSTLLCIRYISRSTIQIADAFEEGRGMWYGARCHIRRP